MIALRKAVMYKFTQTPYTFTFEYVTTEDILEVRKNTKNFLCKQNISNFIQIPKQCNSLIYNLLGIYNC